MYTLSHTHRHRLLISTPTIETALCSSEFALPVLHLRRAISGLTVYTVVSNSTSILVHWFIHTEAMMALHYIEIFLGILGFGLSIMFCTTFCRACSRFREEQIEREADGEDFRVPRHSQELHAPPRYSTTAYSGPPPPYNELGCKPDDLPPAYTECNVPVYPITPQRHTDMVQSETVSQP
ncbi:uncharacterized protein AKAME5_002610800 [Lates japonicus]|uniref:Uncharacterized protein n=1 Tax=Lates japonicus TaxID=270547 RepID=A0AAD3RND0_LATJO|nr:uncharacterized protein AKAME5_002610800 [Lates japonicus]